MKKAVIRRLEVRSDNGKVVGHVTVAEEVELTAEEVEAKEQMEREWLVEKREREIKDLEDEIIRLHELKERKQKLAIIMGKETDARLIKELNDKIQVLKVGLANVESNKPD